MPVSPETQWVLVACGLIAHADGEIDGNEAERLMAMVDETIPADDYADWLGWIGDRAKLEQLYASLPDPPAEQHRNLLEEAWTMAMVDGNRNTEELLVLARLADRLGVEPMQLEFWREAWTKAEQAFARLAVQAAAWSLAGGEPLFEADHSGFLDLVERVPTSHEDRTRLRDIAPEPDIDRSALGRDLAAMPKSKRLRLFKLVGPLVRDAAAPEPALERFGLLAKDAGLATVAIDDLLG